MPINSSPAVITRLLQTLREIPKAPCQITVQDLTTKLKELGFEVGERTVQRDLDNMAQVLPLERNDKSKPYGWRWSKGATYDVPSMSLKDSLIIHLLNKYLHHVLPPSLIPEISGLLNQAEQTIVGSGENNQLTRWLDSVVIEEATQPLIAPKIERHIQSVIYEALYKQYQIKAVYHSRTSNQPKEMRLHPLGLIHRGKSIYLGATANDYEQIRLFALHRFVSADISLDDAQPRNQQSWQDYIAQGAGGFGGSGETLKVVAWVCDDLGEHLMETPLSEDQTLIELEDGYQLTARVFDTWQFYWWILSQGSRIRIDEPTEWRESIKREVFAMQKLYS